MNLKQIQQEFKRLVKSPNSLEELSTVLPVQDTNPRFPILKRIGVYKNAYRIRIQESLQEDFPKTFKLLPKPLKPLIMEFTNQYPSNTFTLSNYSEYFPKFISEKFRDDSYLQNLAYFEWYTCLVQYGQRCPDIDFAELTQKSEEDLLNTRFVLAPYVVLLKSDYDLTADEKTVKKSFYLFTKNSSPDAHVEISEMEFQIVQDMRAQKTILEILDNPAYTNPQEIFVIFQKLSTLSIIKNFIS